MKTVAFHTLGCKVNSCESAAIHAAFLAAGYSPAEEDSPADVYIINSCAVTSVGVPTQVGNRPGWSDVALGVDHAVGIRADS